MFLYPAPLSCFLTFALCVKLAINNSCLETQCSRSLCHYCEMCYDIVFVGCRGHGAGERHVCHLGWEGAWTQTLWHFPSRTPGAVCSCKWASALWSPVITYDLRRSNSDLDFFVPQTSHVLQSASDGNKQKQPSRMAYIEPGRCVFNRAVNWTPGSWVNPASLLRSQRRWPASMPWGCPSTRSQSGSLEPWRSKWNLT